MSTSAIHTKLILFERAMGGSPDAFETIGEVTGYDGPSMSAPSIDATSFDSAWAEKLVGVPDGGQVTFQYNVVQDNGPQQRLREDFEAGTLRAYRIRKADGTLPQRQFSAHVAALSESGAVNEKVSASCTLEITGAVE
jgi:predicted secreted protein